MSAEHAELDEALRTVHERLTRFTEHGDADAITSEQARTDARHLLGLAYREVPEGVQLVPLGIQLAAGLFWYRCEAVYARSELPEFDDEVSAIVLTEQLREIDPELLPQHLRTLVLDPPQLYREGAWLLNQATAQPQFDHQGVRTAVRKFRLAAELGQQHPDALAYWGSLGGTLIDLYQCDGDLAALDEAVTILRAVIGQTPADADTRHLRAALGAALVRRYSNSKQSADLDEAERELLLALDSRPPGPETLATFADLASARLARLRAGALGADLDATIEATRTTVEAMPDAHPSFADFALEHVALLSVRADSAEAPSAALDEAVALLRRLRAATKPQSTPWVSATATLVAAHLVRYEEFGVDEDFDTAADFYSVLETGKPPDAEQACAALLPHLRAALRRRQPITGEFSDEAGMLRSASTAMTVLGYQRDEFRVAVSVLSRQIRARLDIEVPAILDTADTDAAQNLAQVAAQRFQDTGDRVGLAYARNLYEYALRAPVNSPASQAMLGWTTRIGWDRPLTEGGLVSMYSVPDEFRRIPDVDPAGLESVIAELDACLRDGPADTGGLRVQLASAHLLAGRPEQAVGQFRTVVRDEAAAPWLRLHAAVAAARLTSAAGEGPAALGAYAEAIELLRLDGVDGGQGLPDTLPEAGEKTSVIVSLNLSHDDVETAIRRADDLYQTLSEAANARTSWRHLHDYSGLPGEAAAVALEAGLPERAVELLERGRGVIWHNGAQTDRAMPFSELRRAAEAGPVVLVNVSRARCDALVVRAEGPVAVVSLRTGFDEVMNNAGELLMRVRPGRDIGNYVAAQESLQRILGWLWEHIAGPVLAEVAGAERIWWCPTGPLTLLPLHAAAPPEAEGALDTVISSYTLSLTQLLRARSQARQSSGHRLAVGVPGDGDGYLSNVDSELASIGAVEKVLRGEAATAEAVLAELGRHAWVHFACHARQDLDQPAQGHLVLHDRPLPIAEIAELRLDTTELAFLSACESAASARLPDEAISLAGALQHAGYRHVIATLWSIPDRPEIAAAFYRALDKHPGSPAAAIHHALRAARTAHPYEPALWAAYQHFGP